MPNYVQHKITLSGDKERIAELLDFVMSDDSEFDFNKIVPMPASLDIDEGSLTGRCLQAILMALSPITRNVGEIKKSWEEYSKLAAMVSKQYPDIDLSDNALKTLKPEKEDIEKGNIYLNNMLQYGYATWYNWCIENWGTKWNAMDVCTDEDDTPDTVTGKHVCTIYFMTAWSACLPILESLSEKFPDIKISLEWADEDVGSNTGTAVFENGNIDINEYEDQSKEAYELYAEVWDVDLEDEGFVFNEETQTYEYDD